MMYKINTIKEIKENCENFNKIGFLDIETTGLSVYDNDISLIGLHSLIDTNIYVDKNNHNKALQNIKNYNYIITFNGNRFDIPFINACYGLNCDFISLDIMYPLRELGYTGGLKNIENVLGLSRNEAVLGVNGSEAVKLWRNYKKGNKESLNKLVKYNFEDIVNLEVLYNFVLNKAKGNIVNNNDIKQWKVNILNRIKESNSFNVWD